jgi:predicted transposase/invertase (TIGR01784 family)
MATLVRFDWAVKKLLRNKANFGILEGFLSELFGFDVHIEQLLESESNKQHEQDKFNRVDILVRTDQDELMLVEVQNDAEIDYFHRILYGTSKLVTEYIREGEGYGTIKKIISVSILYFRLGQGNDYVYEFKGDFIGRNLKDTLRPNRWQKNKFQIETVSDILPKYFILKVNNFNDVAKNTLDEWIYFLKNSELPASFSAKGLKEAGEKLRIDQLPDSERKAYDAFKESRWIEKDVTETAELMGQTKAKLAMADRAKAKGLSDELITELTGLTPDDIEQIRAEL